MASIIEDQKRPSIVGTVAMLFVVIIVGFLAWQLVTGLIFSLIRLVIILAAFYIIARLGLYLLRKGR